MRTTYRAMTDVRAVYRADAPRTNTFAFYALVGEPQGCVDGDFFVAFRLPCGQRFVQVMDGDPGDPWGATVVGSASKLLS
ncbi:hypothetical protein ACF1AB_05505 [Streptomyces sp. NPDC014846]|uniref:hypothetical protein n=1 Tax=Streptomyces sp. NPDC014846 TaxID=3364922 RepID=UPI0037010C1A